MSKEPAYMYYPADWRTSPVFGCTIAARGLWHEMMDMAFSSERYGYLSIDGKPAPDEVIARYCGVTLPQYLTLVAELFVHGVPRKTPQEIIYSHRMVADYERRCKWRKSQKKHRLTVRHKDVNGDVIAMSSPSSSSVSSPPVSQKQNQKIKHVLRDLEIPEWFPQEVWDAFAEMRQKIRAPLTMAATKLAIKKLTKYRDRGIDPSAVLENSVLNSYRGLWPPGDENQERRKNGGNTRLDRDREARESSLRAAETVYEHVEQVAHAVERPLQHRTGTDKPDP